MLLFQMDHSKSWKTPILQLWESQKQTAEGGETKCTNKNKRRWAPMILEAKPFFFLESGTQTWFDPWICKKALMKPKLQKQVFFLVTWGFRKDKYHY